ncbi:MAG: 50S ribosomal protein L19 [Bacteroidales bacterium]|nr:50S ribosomal protein L19 [Bacteroidales bacterium]
MLERHQSVTRYEAHRLRSHATHGEGTAGVCGCRHRLTVSCRVEKLFPFGSPWIEKIEVVKKTPSWRSKLYTERTFCSHKAVRKLVKK